MSASARRAAGGTSSSPALAWRSPTTSTTLKPCGVARAACVAGVTGGTGRAALACCAKIGLGHNTAQSSAPAINDVFDWRVIAPALSG